MSPRSLRSARWFEPDDLRRFGHRSRAHQMGYDERDWAGRLIVTILNTQSDINPWHAYFRHRVENVRIRINNLPIRVAGQVSCRQVGARGYRFELSIDAPNSV